ncbi:MAG TPA: alpha/beta fold hydrolase, partial [Anaerolineales bacterium]|nr:alpha/beta fold hydrolase [Anaerolineales bacterium]
MRSWRYYRNSLIYYFVIAAMIAAAIYTIRHLAFWLVTVFLWFISLPMRHALAFAHPPHSWSRVTEEELKGFEQVHFKSHDGLALSGWFWPGTNHAALILVHGLGSSGAEMIVHGKLLAEKGFGVLLLDLRAHGYSNGDTSTFGLREADDIAGALDFLLECEEIDSDKISALGISLGAQAVLRGALKENRVRALVLEGLGPSVLEDHGGRPNSLVRWINYPFNWLYYYFYYFMIGSKDKGVL